LVFYEEFLLFSLEVLSLIFTARLKTQLSKGTKKLLDGRKRPENKRKKTEPKKAAEPEDGNKNRFTPTYGKGARTELALFFEAR